MTEFGHFATVTAAGSIDAWGAGPFWIEVDGKLYRFEDSDRFGPALVNKKGDLLSNPYPSERSPFWRAHRVWMRQGRRLEDGRVCIWDEPKPMIIRRMGKRNALVIDPGEEDGKVMDESGKIVAR